MRLLIQPVSRIIAQAVGGGFVMVYVIFCYCPDGQQDSGLTGVTYIDHVRDNLHFFRITRFPGGDGLFK